MHSGFDWPVNSLIKLSLEAQVFCTFGLFATRRLLSICFDMRNKLLDLQICERAGKGFIRPKNPPKTWVWSDKLIREQTGQSDPECKLSLHISGLWHTFCYVFVRDCCIQHTTRRAPRGQPEQWHDGVQISGISCVKGRIVAREDARVARFRARVALVES